jgi:ATP-dependent protease ClpP protease subunit
VALTLYRAGESHAKSLIDAGKVDETSDWSFSAEDGDKILGDPPNWDAYASWHLGHDDSEDSKTKAAWSYPFGKDGKLYRSALRAIRTRASQQNETEIYDAAGRLLNAMDKRSTDNVLQFKPRAKQSRKVAVVNGQPRQWYRIDASADDQTVADVYVYDDIGESFWSEGVTAKAFIDDLNALPKSVQTIRLHINSPGGDVFDAIAIANALRQHQASVTAMIEGLCASAATIVAAAGDTVQVADNAIVMVHDPLTLAYGNASDLRDVADVLDRVRDAIVATYQWHSPLDAEQLRALMAATTWMNADEAIANGFATEKVEGLRAAALLEPRALGALEVPDRYRNQIAAFAKAPAAPPAAADAAEVLAAVESAGLSTAVARELVAAKLPIADVQARIAAKVAERDQATAREREITALCATAKVPELAAGYVGSNMPVASIREHLTTITARLDRAEIDGGLDPDRGVRAKPKISVAAVYAERNKLAKKE